VYGVVPPVVVAVKVTGLPAAIVVGLTEKSVTSVSGLIAIEAVLDAVAAFMSVMVTLTVNEPFTVYV